MVSSTTQQGHTPRTGAHSQAVFLPAATSSLMLPLPLSLFSCSSPWPGRICPACDIGVALEFVKMTEGKCFRSILCLTEDPSQWIWGQCPRRGLCQWMDILAGRCHKDCCQTNTRLENRFGNKLLDPTPPLLGTNQQARVKHSQQPLGLF